MWISWVEEGEKPQFLYFLLISSTWMHRKTSSFQLWALSELVSNVWIWTLDWDSFCSATSFRLLTEMLKLEEQFPWTLESLTGEDSSSVSTTELLLEGCNWNKKEWYTFLKYYVEKIHAVLSVTTAGLFTGERLF